MIPTRNARARGAAAALLLVLCGCDVTLPWTSAAPSNAGDSGTLGVSPGSIALRAELGAATPSPVALAIEVSSSAYLGVRHAGAAVANAALRDGGGGRPEVIVTFPSPATVGMRTGTVTVIACHDQACASPLQHSPVTVSVTYAVGSGLQASPGAISAEWTRGTEVATLAPVALTESGVTSGTATASVQYVGTPGWLDAQSTAIPGSSRVTLTPSDAMAAGVYFATIRYASGTGRAVEVPVSFTVRDPPVLFRASPSTFLATWTRGAAIPAPLDVALTEVGVTAGAATAAVGFGSASGWLTATAATVPGSSTVSLAPADLEAGVHTANIRYTSATTRTVDVPVSLTVREAAVSASPASLAFDGVVGAAPPAAKTTALVAGAVPATYAVAVDYGGGPSGWLTAPTSVTPPQALSLVPATTTLPRGATTYTATVSFRSGDGIVCGTLPVSYALQAPTLTDPPDRTVIVTPNTVSLDLSGSAAVTVSGGLELDWSASSSAGWLVLDRTFGLTGERVAYRIDPAVLSTLEYGAARTATVTVTTWSPILTQSFDVTVENRLPEVRTVMPSVQVAGKASRVRVRGVGLAALDLSGLQPVEGVTAASVTRLSDTALVIDLPAIPAGDRAVRIPSALGVAARAAQLHHVEPATSTYARVEQLGNKRSLLLDARRRAVLGVNHDQSAVVRFAQVDGVWTPTVRSIAGLVDLGLSPDGDLLVAAAGNTVRLLDPVTLADVRTYPSSSSSAYSALSASQGLAVMNDGRVALPGVSGWTFAIATFDLERRAFGTIDATGIPLYLYSGPWYLASRDGERVLIVQTASLSPTPPLLYVDATDGKARSNPAGLKFFYEGSLSDDGSRFTTGGTVYDGGFGTVGKLTLPAAAVGYWSVGAVLAPDGSHAYVLAYPSTYLSASSTAPPRVFVFDTHAVPASGPDLPILRSFDVPDYVSCRVDAYGCQVRPMMVLSPDDQTLFLLGAQGLLVVPIP
jgi:hypothetical protein